MAINFKGNPVNIPPQQVQNKNQKNSIGLTENGQKVLNKTNEYANAYDLVNTVIDSDKRNDNFATVAKNALLMPVMSNPVIGAVYTADQYKKGNITKDDAVKIMAYNAIAQGLSS